MLTSFEGVLERVGVKYPETIGSTASKAAIVLVEAHIQNLLFLHR
jgi:hypothetical protein